MGIHKSYNCYIFDLDGMLMDTSEGSINSVLYTCKEMGFPVLPYAILKTFIGPPIYESFEKHYSLSKDEVIKATEIFRNVYKDKFLFEATPYDNIYQYLEKLRVLGLKTAVATNKRNDYACRLLEHFDFIQYFDYILGSDLENTMKKSDIVRKCMQELNADQTNTVLLGDTIHDSDAAKKCGIDFIGVTYGFGFKSSEEAYAVGAVLAADSINMLIDNI